MKISITRIIVLAAVVAGLVACGKNKGDSGSSVNGRGRAAANPSPTVTSPTGQQIASQSAYVIGADYSQFQEAVKTMVAPTVDPQDVGTVDNRTGVRIAGAIRFNASGTLQTDSQIQLLIQDSGGSSTEPIEISLQNATGTAINGNMNMSFSDEYGTITITGRFTNGPGGTVNGTVAFTNKTGEFNGRTSGTLGTFSVTTCGFFSCAN